MIKTPLCLRLHVHYAHGIEGSLPTHMLQMNKKNKMKEFCSVGFELKKSPPMCVLFLSSKNPPIMT